MAGGVGTRVPLPNSCGHELKGLLALEAKAFGEPHLRRSKLLCSLVASQCQAIKELGLSV